LGGLALVEVAALVLAFFQPKKTREKEGESVGIVEAGAVDKFTLNSVTAFVRGKFLRCATGGWRIPCAVAQVHAPGVHGALVFERHEIRLPLPCLGL